jgi:MFS family permease
LQADGTVHYRRDSVAAITFAGETMSQDRVRFLFLNLGHAYDHLFMLLFPTVVLALETEWGRPYSELLPLALGGFIAFGAGAVPAGWLGDRWSRKHMLTVFFVGIGLASIGAGLAVGPITLAVALTAVGLFASIYHPVGTAMVVQGVEDVGRRLGVNGVWGNLGVAAAALSAGALIQGFGWRAAFIVPGAVSVLTGLVFMLVTPPPRTGAAVKRTAGAGSLRGLPPALIRVFIVLALTTICGGLIFNATLVALPKVFSVRLSGLASTTFGVAGLASLVYVFGAFAQIVVGHLLDRYSLRSILMVVAGLQIPFLLAAASAHNLALLLVAGLMMLTVFGAIPIQDTLVARNTADAWRSRIYALKYLISLGIASVAVPIVALVYGATGDFVWLFGLFAVLSLLIVGIGSFLPKGDAPLVAGLAAAGGGGGD